MIQVEVRGAAGDVDEGEVEVGVGLVVAEAGVQVEVVEGLTDREKRMSS